ncbi:MAG: transposase [Terriglobia bacterium]
MSLPDFDTQLNLFGLAAQSERLFKAEDPYRLFWERVFPLLANSREKLAACYCEDNGRPGIEPVVLLGVSILQFMERVPDREAIQRLRYHLGWKLALGQELAGEEFHPTVLVRFRRRLIEQEQGRLAFDLVLDGLKQAGLLKEGRRQRLDSTHVLGLVAWMSELECIRETLRLALEEIEGGSEARPGFWEELVERYLESQPEYRLSGEVIQQKVQQMGMDMLRLLEWVESQQAVIREGQRVGMLRRVLEEYFEVEENGIPRKRTGKERVVSCLRNPHEPEAEWSAKGLGEQKKEWVGYKVQVAETVEEAPVESGEPTKNYLTAVETERATESDEAGFEQVKKVQAASGLAVPQEWYVDTAYVSGQVLREAELSGQQIWGPAQPAPCRGDRGFKSDQFWVEVEERRAICPAGKQSTQCSQLQVGQSGAVNYRFEWSWQCRDCEWTEGCVGRGQKHRTLVVGQYHTALQQRRQEMKTEAFRHRMQRRHGIEGTLSELIRAHGLRRARYRGYRKVALQNYLIGAASNIKRWLRRLAWQMQQTKRLALNTG